MLADFGRRSVRTLERRGVKNIRFQRMQSEAIVEKLVLIEYVVDLGVNGSGLD